MGPPEKARRALLPSSKSVLGAIDVLALEPPVDAVYGELRARLERAGYPMGANDLLIAAHALTLGHTVVNDSEREFSWIVDLRFENWLR
jgi:tRNA(fMet)-specific endonuclease VapC